MGSENRQVRAVLVGDAESFGALLVDLLADLRVDVSFVTSGDCELVFAVVREQDVVRVLDVARSMAHGAPVVAVMPIRDSRLAQRAILAGASTICTLDGPLDGLRLTLMQVLSRRRVDEKSGASA